LEFRHKTLDNGLEIVADCNEKAHSTALAFFVKTGSRDENDANSGVSHFLEHMAFKGTATRTAADVNRELDEIGSHANACTGEEQTVYYATVLPEHQARAVEILADIMRPSLREEDFDTEKKVILEEILKYEDQPPFGAHEKCMAAHFGTHPLGRSVLGTSESVGALTPDAMREYFQNRYSPGNMVLVAAGRTEFDRLVALAQEHCGDWHPFVATRETPPAAPHCGFKVVRKESAVQAYAVQVANGPAAQDDDRYAGRVLATIVGDDTGSRFYWDLVDTGRAEYAVMFSYDYQGTGVLMTCMGCAAEDTSENLERIREVQRDVEKKGVGEAELERAKSKISSRVVLRSERPANRMFAVGNNWVQRRQYRTVKDVVDAYRAITRDDVADVLAKHPLTVNTTVAIGPFAHVKPPRA